MHTSKLPTNPRTVDIFGWAATVCMNASQFPTLYSPLFQLFHSVASFQIWWSLNCESPLKEEGDQFHLSWTILREVTISLMGEARRREGFEGEEGAGYSEKVDEGFGKMDRVCVGLKEDDSLERLAFLGGHWERPPGCSGKMPCVEIGQKENTARGRERRGPNGRRNAIFLFHTLYVPMFFFNFRPPPLKSSTSCDWYISTNVQRLWSSSTTATTTCKSK